MRRLLAIAILGLTVAATPAPVGASGRGSRARRPAPSAKRTRRARPRTKSRNTLQRSRRARRARRTTIIRTINRRGRLHRKIRDGYLEGGDMVPMPRPTRPASSAVSSKLPRGAVIRSVADARRLGLDSSTDAPIFVIGHGMRTQAKVLDALARDLGAIIIAAKLHDPAFYHADTALGILPHGVHIYDKALEPRTVSLLEHLYPGHVTRLNRKEAEAFGTNGRLLKRPGREGRSQHVYFYPAGSLGKRFFTELDRRYPNATVRQRKEGRGRSAHQVHELRYTIDGKTHTVTFVPMPMSQALLGGGAVSCTTLTMPDGETLVMAPPEYFELSAGQNPQEDAALASGAFNRDVARAEYAVQRRRYQQYGFRVRELSPRKQLTEQIYTRDTGYFFRVAKDGRAYDPVFGPRGGTPMFLQSSMKNEVRQLESREVGALWNR